MLVSRRLRIALFLSLLACCHQAGAQTPEYRASWVDAFHPGFMSQDELTSTIGNLRAGNVNVFVPEVYVNSGYQHIYWSPTPAEYPSLGSPGTIVSNGVSIKCDLSSEAETNSGGSYDALGESIAQCHDTTGGKARLDVWAWMVAFRSAGAIRVNHPEWITVNGGGLSSTDFDAGHPGSEQQLVNNCMDIVKHYDVDGLNFDYIRLSNANDGFNAISVRRYNAIKGKSGTPTTDDAEFKQWRRDQITNVIRKIYLSVIAIKPNVKISADTIMWSPSPARPFVGDPNPLQTWRTNFESTSAAFTSVLQDWRSWMEEGILDIAMPMAYLYECSYRTTFDKWCDFTKDNQFGRQCVIGTGGYLNLLPDNLAQYARTRQPSSTMGKYGAGQNNYSYAYPYASLCGKSTASVADPVGWFNALKADLYAQPAVVPALPRLTNGKGHIKGTVVSSLVASPGWVDGATVYLSAKADGSNPVRTMQTDGTGFYGFVDVPPGSYYVKVHAANHEDQIQAVSVTSAAVSTVDFTLAGPLPATQLAFSVQPGGAATSVAFTRQPVVVARDSAGSLISGFNGPVTLAIKSGAGAPDAALVGTATVNAVNGVASFSGLSINRPGSDYALTASSGSLASADSSVFQVAVVPTLLVFSRQPGGASTGVPFTTQPTVAAMDVFGNVATGFSRPVTLQIKAGTGAAGAALNGAFSRSAVGGVAAFSDLSISKAGAGYVLTAAATGLSSGESDAFAVAVVPTRLAFSAYPSGAVIGQPLAPRPVVVATDDDGNTALSFSGPVTLSIAAGTGVPGAALDGTLTVNALSGVATFDGLTIDKVGFAYRLHAVSGSLIATDSYAFDIRTSATRLALTAQPGGARAGRPFARQPVVVALNVSGEIATDYNGPLYVEIKQGAGSSTAWLDGTVSIAMAGGIGAFTDLAINEPATGYVLTMSSPPLPNVDSAAFEVVSSGPYTFAEVIRTLTIAGGLVSATDGDITRLDVDGAGRVDLLDATRITRKAAGLETNP
ncbi:MAG TPA: family 10 glycosylhydrolase [Armatimonadota bacterium]|jgi:uncharacterized lipoprotein YddW (UPF0748 family)